jgi:hypothetical protein
MSEEEQQPAAVDPAVTDNSAPVTESAARRPAADQDGHCPDDPQWRKSL